MLGSAAYIVTLFSVLGFLALESAWVFLDHIERAHVRHLTVPARAVTTSL
jgi:hypothetical protein